MKFGMHLGIRGPAAAPDSLIEIARAAEAMGFEHLGFSDHVIIAATVDSIYPYTSDGRWFAHDTGECLEQLSTMSFVAAATQRIRLLTSVMVLPHRQPLLAAKMLTTVDILSKGRLTVGVGVGWMEEEIAVLGGPPFRQRGKASNEMIEAFRKLWTLDRPEMQGKHVAFENVLFSPKPVQKPHPPIWIGGEGRAARRRAGELGDGWYPIHNNPAAPLDTVERYAGGLADVREAAAQAGRRPDAITAALFVIGHTMDHAVLNAEGGRRCFTGTPADIRSDVAAFEDAGLQHLVIGFEANTTAEVLRRMQVFAEAVG